LPAPSDPVFELLFARAGHPIFVLDPARDRIRYANSSACALLGYEAGELLAMPTSTLCRADAPDLREFLDATGWRGDGWTISLALRTKAGAFRPAELLGFRFVTNGRQYVLMLAEDRSQHRSRPG
jgi:PAS domain S-box-containing protein